MWEKFKSIVAHEQIFASVLVVLVGIISFGLGRADIAAPMVSTQTATVQLAPEPFIIQSSSGSQSPNTQVALPGASSMPASPSYVASVSGSRYHLLDCPSVSQIKESNKVYFATTDEAEAAGYTKAANCPGL